MKSLKIEPVQERDLDDVIDLLQHLSQFRPESTRSLFEEHSKQENVFSFVGKIDDGLVAYSSIMIEHKIRGGRLGHIEDVIVSPILQNRGIGSKMVQHLVAVAKERKCYKVVLASRAESQAFYEFLGFHSIAKSFELFLEP